MSLYDTGVPEKIECEHENGLAMFRASVASAPDRDLIRYFDMALTTSQVDALSDALATALADVGVQREDRIALYLQNVPQFVISLIASWKLGAIVVPCNPMLRERELTKVLNDCTATTLVALESLYADTAAAVVAQTAVRAVLTTSELDFLDESNVPTVLSTSIRRPHEATHDLLELTRAYGGQRPAPIDLGPDDIALLQYTSGTTGPPKGAMITHRNFVFISQVFRDWIQADDDEIVLGIAPLFHITGIVAHIGIALAAPAPLVLGFRFDPAETCRMIERHRATFTVAAITAYLAMLSCSESRDCDLSSFRKAFSGGAPIPPAVVDAFEARTGVQIRAAYGLTETTGPTHLTPVGRRLPVDSSTGTLATGIPVPNTGIRILDEAGMPVPTGETGEVAVSGPQVIPGYWQNKAESDRVLKNGELLTGDIGKVDEEGWLYIVDRKKDLIVASGYKIWPREVEDVLYEHPAVREAAVIGVPDPYRGETVKAFVSLKPGVSIEDGELERHARGQLAAYKVPRSVIVLDDLPKSSAGKILRRELRSRDASSAPE
jgi:long-chain acyl-CoA synthetase